MKRILFLSMALIISSTSISQGIDPPDDYAFRFIYQGKELDVNRIDGSAYQKEKFQKGKVFFAADDTKEYYMRYNVFLNEMEFISGDKVLTIDNPEKTKKIELDGQTFRYMSYFDDNNNLVTGYLIVLVEGEYNLYKQLNIEFKEGEPAETSFHQPKPDRFVRGKDVYFFNHDSPLAVVPKSRNNFLTFINEDTDRVKDFIKDEKIRLNDEEDLIRLFQFLQEIGND